MTELVSGVCYARTYRFLVVAHYADSAPGMSEVVSFTTPAAPPVPALTGLTAKALPQAVDLKWNSLPAALAYRVYRNGMLLEELRPKSYVSGERLDTTYLHQTAPEPATYEVRAVFSPCRFAASHGAEALSIASVPLPVSPSGFRAAVRSGGYGIALTWNAAPGASHYLLSGSGVTERQVSTTDYIVENPPPGPHTWQLTAYYTQLGGYADAANPARATLPRTAGRYRVTIDRFRVNRQTWDNALQTDGKGDEVFFKVILDHLGGGNYPGEPSFGVRDGRLFSTDVFGDKQGYAGRNQAGSASAAGGLVSGDVVNIPASAWKPLFDDPKNPSKQYTELWSGELMQTRDLVVLCPTVWEWDGHDPENRAGSWGPATGKRIKEWEKNLLNFLNAAGAGPTVISFQQWGVTHPLISPIGMIMLDKPEGWNEDRPLGGSMTQNSWLLLSPPSLILTVNTIEAALAGQTTGTIEMRYQDWEKLQGDYSVYVRLERIS